MPAQAAKFKSFPVRRRGGVRPLAPNHLSLMGRGSQLICGSLSRVHAQRSVRNNESASHFERVRPSVGFDTESCRLRAFLQHPLRPIRDRTSLTGNRPNYSPT